MQGKTPGFLRGAPHVLLRWRGFVVEGEVGGHHGTVCADVEIARNPGAGPWPNGADGPGTARKNLGG